MKELIKPHVKNKENIVEYMVNRHGNTFTECLENETLNKDYSKHPTQVLMKHNVDKELIKKIKPVHYEKLRKKLVKMGYVNDKKIIDDEIQAFMSTGLYNALDKKCFQQYEKVFIKNFKLFNKS
jgi:hypothetical protein